MLTVLTPGKGRIMLARSIRVMVMTIMTGVGAVGHAGRLEDYQKLAGFTPVFIFQQPSCRYPSRQAIEGRFAQHLDYQLLYGYYRQCGKLLVEDLARAGVTRADFLQVMRATEDPIKMCLASTAEQGRFVNALPALQRAAVAEGCTDAGYQTVLRRVLADDYPAAPPAAAVPAPRRPVVTPLSAAESAAGASCAITTLDGRILVDERIKVDGRLLPLKRTALEARRKSWSAPGVTVSFLARSGVLLETPDRFTAGRGPLGALRVVSGGVEAVLESREECYGGEG